MRMFKRYIPGLIAKHVFRLFKGRMYIYGVGAFEFDNGKVKVPKEPKNRHFNAVREINLAIAQLRLQHGY